MACFQSHSVRLTRTLEHKDHFMRPCGLSLIMCQEGLAPCEDRVLIWDTITAKILKLTIKTYN